MLIRVPCTGISMYGCTTKRTHLVYERHTSREFPLQLKGGQSHCYSVGAEIQFDIVLEYRMRITQCSMNII